MFLLGFKVVKCINFFVQGGNTGWVLTERQIIQVTRGAFALAKMRSCKLSCVQRGIVNAA